MVLEDVSLCGAALNSRAKISIIDMKIDLIILKI